MRILASENLSATEEVIITEDQGVTVISDIDDTIKHTSMLNGAREAFRNAFIRDLADLSIEGVKEWYTRLSKLGVKFHYVSNSPWQLYPTLTKYMSMAGLPPGSVHLKLYSGMLQGIFEPVAERKKFTMDRLARDFPNRKFILVGDSGEADLEVYTDFVIENPGKVLAVYIRDVTTSKTTRFFDSSMGPLNGDRGSGPRQSAADSIRKSNAFTGDINSDDEADLKAAIEASLREAELEEKHRRPDLPQRRPTDPPAPQRTAARPVVENLIDFSDEEYPAPVNPRLQRSFTDSAPSLSPGPLMTSLESGKKDGSGAAQRNNPPMPPRKPVALRGPQNNDQSPSSQAVQTSSSHSGESWKKQRPPRPRRPSTSVKNHEPRTASPLATMRSAESEVSTNAAKPRPPIRQSSHSSLAKQKLTSTYNRLPPAQSILSSAPGEHTRAMSSQRSLDVGADYPPRRSGEGENSNRQASNGKPKPPPPPPPPRRGLSAYPAAAAQYASNRVSTAWNSYNNSSGGPMQTSSLGSNGNSGASSSPPVNKREDMWRRRWVRAESILKDRGVLLRSWRVGGDVADESVELVEKVLKDMRSWGKVER